MPGLGSVARFEWVASDRARDVRDGGALLLAVAWLIYTRLYFVLHPLGLTAAPSLFMYLTGRPDPLCGLTRTFAWMWRGDVARAAAVYPLGPAVFAASLPLTALLAAGLVTRRSPRLVLSRRASRLVAAVAVLALLANWTAKLVWLGN